MNKMMVSLVFLLAISVSLGIGIMVQQYFVWGHVWDLGQTLHHEFFAAVCFAFSFGVLAAVLLFTRGHRR